MQGKRRIEVRNVSKSFPGVQALDDVSVEIAPGEIHALLGENGAGKSTIGKIVGGIHHADKGEVLLDGVAINRISEAEANKLGIGIVHQEGSLVRQLSVAENIFPGRQPTGIFGQIDRRKMRARAKAILQQLGVSIDPDERVSRLSPAQGQVVEIAKALSHDLKLLILDEPTAALTLTETDALFDVVRRLAGEGVSILYVSHRLAEIFELCHRVTVLKDGKKVGTVNVSETSTDRLIEMMVGRELHFSREDHARKPGEILLEAHHVASGSFVQDGSITVRRGEIVCLSGLVGSGRTELCEAIFGVRGRRAGKVRFLGQDLKTENPSAAIRRGLAMMCEDRKEGGLFLEMSVAANIVATVLPKVTRGGHISKALLRKLADSYVDELKIATPSTDQILGNLSGGNQQKVLLAKWLATEPSLLIIDEPTRGVDVGARSEIYRIIRELANEGVGLLVISSELPEVLTLADRIVVMAEGKTVGEMPGEEADEVSILSMATGKTNISSTSSGEAKIQ